VAGSLTFTANPTNAGVNPVYVWRTNNVTVAGVTANTYTRTGGWVNGDTVSVTVTQDVGSSGLSAQSASATNTITVTANVIPAVGLTTTPGTTICAGTQVTFGATPTNGGSPTYQWYTNDVAVTGATAANYTNNALLHGDRVYVIMTSTDICRSQNTVSSVTNTMSVSATSVGGIATADTSAFCGSGSTQIQVSGNTGAIQWQASSDNVTFTNIPGATSTPYTTPTLTATKYYRAAVTNSPCSGAFSSVATVTVYAPPVAGTAQADQPFLCAGSSTTLRLTGSSGFIQWQGSPDNVTFTNIPAATSATFNTPALTETNYYQAVVTNGNCSAVTSSVVTVTVSTAPGFTTSPTNTATCSGSTVSFYSAASGAPVNYAWRKRDTGWGTNWVFNAGGGGFFIFSSGNNAGGSGNINTSSKSWGMYNNNAGSVTEAVRTFPAPLVVGQQFEMDIDIGYVTSGNSVGFNLRNSAGNAVWRFYYTGFQGWKIDDSSGTTTYNNDAIPYTADGYRVVFMLTDTNRYSCTVQTKPVVGGGAVYGPFTGTLLNPTGGPIPAVVRLWSGNGNVSDSNFDVFFNRIIVNGTADDNAGNYTTWTGDKGNRPLTEGGLYSGTASATLTLTGVTTDDSGGSFDVVAYNPCSYAIANAVTLTVSSVSANPAGYTQTKGQPFKILESNLLTNASGSGGVTLTSVSATSGIGGVPLTRAGGWIFYEGNLTANDSFTYTVTSVNGGCTSASGTVSITAVTVGGIAQNISYDINGVTVTFAGIPGFSYEIQRSATADFASYTTLLITNAPAGGVFSFTDNAPLSPNGFYRTLHP